MKSVKDTRKKRGRGREREMSSYGDLILPCRIKKQIKDWLSEDVPSFDYGGFVVGSKRNRFYDVIFLRS